MADNFSTRPVPQAATVSGLNIFLVITGITISVPAFLIGSQVVMALGLAEGIAACLIGGLTLAAMAGITMAVGVRSRLSSYGLIHQAFGHGGARLVNGVIGLTILGWYSVVAELFAEGLQLQLVAAGIEAPDWLLIVCGSALMILTTVRGFHGMSRLSNFAVPVMFGVLVWGIWAVMRDVSFDSLWARGGAHNAAIPNLAMGIAVVTGSLVVGVAIAPDLGRFARDVRHSSGAALASYTVSYPVILLLSGLPALAFGNPNLMENLMAVGKLPILLLMIFAVWTTNVGNLYSASLAFSRVVPTMTDWKVTIAAGVMGTLIAVLGLSDRLIAFMLWLGILIPPIAGVYVVHHFRHKSGDHQIFFRPRAFVAWGVASLVAWLGMSDVIHITSIFALDSILVAMAVYAMLLALPEKRRGTHSGLNSAQPGLNSKEPS